MLEDELRNDSLHPYGNASLQSSELTVASKRTEAARYGERLTSLKMNHWSAMLLATRPKKSNATQNHGCTEPTFPPDSR